MTDTERLNFLIKWFGTHDDFKGSGVRDWRDAEDARKAIDAAIRANRRRKGKGSAHE